MFICTTSFSAAMFAVIHGLCIYNLVAMLQCMSFQWSFLPNPGNAFFSVCLLPANGVNASCWCRP